MERIMRKESERRTYLIATVMSSVSITSMAIASTYYHFSWQMERLGGLSYFTGAENKDGRILVPDLGSLTSIHDRERDLLYYLKGGQVDYDEEHSRNSGHSQFGKIYEQGHYSSWDEQPPIHFVGHSTSVQVIRVFATDAC
ncbi:hypothetical protein Cni_G19773 [Canna indica]|uniref:Lipase-like C-terminal domain-containing protein n=1 Tax=Canna indica TaxID=4628 RepID=A0AAQ3KS98_9LILI|nr:hypothetical protein Cni_G19773 [Canna indica]